MKTDKISVGCKKNNSGVFASYMSQIKHDVLKNKSQYIMLLIPLIWYIVFCYIPMFGILIGFQDYNVRRGILGSEWIGFENFRRFLIDPYFMRSFVNTLRISLASIIFGFPMPIIFALLINELTSKRFVKVVQIVTYIPHFISLVVLCGMIKIFVSDTGIITEIVEILVGHKIGESLLNRPELFTSIFVLSGIWQGVGWSSIIYIATISGIDQELYDAASIDGAGRLRQALSVTIPSILPTIILMFILRVGSVINVDYEKIMLLINQLNAEKAEVLSYYVYKKGIMESDYSLSTAANLFNSIINLFFVVSCNTISRKLSDISLW